MSHRPVHLLALLVAALAAVSAAPAAAQGLYVPPEADFGVAFPGPPSVQARPAKRFADVGVRRYAAEAPDDAMIVLVQDYPDGQLPASANGAVYDRMLRSRAEDGGPPLVTTRPARLAGQPCLEGVFQDREGGVELVRVLMTGQRVYQVSFIYAGDPARPPPAAAAFFGSFRLMKAGA